MKILSIYSSAKTHNSRSRELTKKISLKLQSLSKGEIIQRDLTQNLNYLSEAMIDRYYVDEDQLSDEDKKILAPSDELVDELLAADAIVVGAPMYNFTITGMLKVYIDQICRLGKTFSTTKDGFQGLLENKVAHVVITTGGTRVGGDDDFMTEYLKRFFNFIGITDIHFYVIDQLDQKQAETQKQALLERISAITL